MIQIDGAACAAALTGIEAEILSSARQALGQAAAFAAVRAKQTTAFKDRSGNLRASVVRGEQGPWSLFVKAGGKGVKYALFIEDGTKPHVIEAKRAKTLHFVWNGVPFFARRVHHPGTKPTHFMLDARNEAEQQLVRFVGAGHFTW